MVYERRGIEGYILAYKHARCGIVSDHTARPGSDEFEYAEGRLADYLSRLTCRYLIQSTVIVR